MQYSAVDADFDHNFRVGLIGSPFFGFRRNQARPLYVSPNPVVGNKRAGPWLTLTIRGVPWIAAACPWMSGCGSLAMDEDSSFEPDDPVRLPS
jgi:hypothetical protein